MFENRLKPRSTSPYCLLLNQLWHKGRRHSNYIVLKELPNYIPMVGAALSAMFGPNISDLFDWMLLSVMKMFVILCQQKWQLLQTLILNVFNLACIHHTGKCQIKQARTAITGEMGKLPNWLQWIWNRFFNSHFRTTIAAAGVKGFVLFWKTFSCVLRPSIGTATAK